MASSKLPGPHKRTLKPNDPGSNNHPTPRESVANKYDLELEQRCKDHITSLQISAEEDLSDLESFNGVEWPKEEAPWSPDVQRQVHRYMHENNLYQVSNLDDPVFVDLVDLVKSRAGIPNTRNWEQRVPDKCRSLINASARTLKRDGLLVTHNNLTRKTEIFQYLWDCAIQAARVSHWGAQSIERTFPRVEPGNTASSVDFDSMTGAGWSLEDSHSRKRNAGSIQQSRSSSPKRARAAQLDVREDGEGDSIEVDCSGFYVASPERHLADENTRHMSVISAAAPSDGRHHTDGNIPAKLMDGLESTVMTPREALLGLGPAEKGRGSLEEGIQLSPKNVGLYFANTTHGDPAPAECPTQENHRTNATSWSPSRSNTTSSLRPSATGKSLDQAASPKPIAAPNTNQSDSFPREGLPSIRQTTNRDVMDTSLNPATNNGHVISSSKPHEAENSNSYSIPRIMNPLLENAPEASQAERRYYSLTAQIAAQVSQTLIPPNHQPPFADGVQSSPSNQSGDGITSPGNSDIISEKGSSPTPSENSRSSNCSDRVVNAPQVAAYHQNSSQNGGDSQFPFERRSSQSFNTAGTIAHQPTPSPPRRTDQSRNTEPPRFGPSGPPPPPGPPPLSCAPNPNKSLPPAPHPPGLPGPPPPHISPQNAWQNGPPPSPPRTSNQSQGPPGPAPASRQNAWQNCPPPPPPRTLNQNQGPPPPPMSQNAWPNGPPPPPPRTSNQNQGPPPSTMPQNAWPNCPPPPPPRALNQSQGPPPPPLSPQNQRSSAPLPSPLVSAQSQWSNGPPPPPPRALYQNQGPPPPPPHPVSTQNRSYSAPHPSLPTANQSEGPSVCHPLPPPSIIPQYQRPPGPPPPAQCQNLPPSPAQVSPSSSAALTQYQSPYPTDASSSVAGPPLFQSQSLDQQQPSSSPWYSPQHIGQPPPAPKQNQPVGPPLTPTGLASGITFPSSTLSLAGQQSLEPSAVVWKKYNEMVIIHVPVSVQTDANVTNAGLRTQRTYRFPGGDVFKHTVTELFQWISGLLNTALPPQLVFEFIDVHSILERRMILHQGDSKLLEAVKTIVWESFREIEKLDPAVANVKILIIPIFSAALGSVGENMQQKSQQLYYANKTSNIPSDQPSYLSVPNQNGSSITSDSARRPSITKPGGPPPFGPPPQSQNSFHRSPVPDTINSHAGPSKSAPSSMPTPHNKNTPEGNISSSKDNMVEAHAPSNPDPQRQPQQQSAQLPAPNCTKIDNNTASMATTTKIVIRIQIDGHGRLSRSYDKSTLNTRITSSRFFAWFAQETGHTSSGKLRFDFKDALPAKSSVIAAGNGDHFDLMVHDIKRKFDRAKEYAPDMNEFCIVVTDPQWNSRDEDEDEDE